MRATVALVAILVVVGAGLTLWLYGAYAGLRGLRLLVDRSWAQVDDELRRRHDLVPDLLAAVRDRVRPAPSALDVTLEALAAARSAGPAVPVRAEAERALSQALAGLFAVTDAHPVLRADESYLALRRELADLQDRATAARRLYNANVGRLAAARAGFPGSFVARLVRVPAAQPAGSVGADPLSARPLEA